MLPNLNQPNRMKKLLFILTLLAMVVFPNVAPAQEPSERCHLSDGVGLVAREDRQGREGEEAGIAALPSEQGATLAPGDLRIPNACRRIFQRSKSVASHHRKSRVSARRLVFAFGCSSDFSEASRQNRLEGIRSVTFSEEGCHLYGGRLSPLRREVVTLSE